MRLNSDELKILEERSRLLRLQIFDYAKKYGGYHFGGSLSSVEILVDLYQKILTDQFILSKGHASLAWYPLLEERGYHPRITEHPDRDEENGIHCTTGSLGMGLPTGVGMAMAKKIMKKEGRVYVLLGEAELQEGTAWESLLLASQYKLDNLTGIIDYNHSVGSGKLEEILSLGNLKQKLNAFDAYVLNIDGHSHQEIINALTATQREKCTMIIANTIKGKGVRFMEEDQYSWHAKSPNKDQLRQLYEELGGKLNES